MSSSNHAHDASAWSSHAKVWSSATQQITRAPCMTLLSKLSDLLPLDPTTKPTPYVLDNGAGAGMLTFLLKQQYPSLHILAADISSGMIDSLREKAEESGGGLDESLETQVLDTQDLKGLADGTFSHVVCSFVTPFIADPVKALREMYRVTRAGGVVGVSTWSRVSWVPVWEKVVRSFGKGYEDYTAPALFHPDTTEPRDVKRQLEDAGWSAVEVRAMEAEHPEKTPKEATEEFYGMGNPSIKLLMEGLEEGLVEQSKERFTRFYEEVYDGGRKRQAELTILAVGRKKE